MVEKDQEKPTHVYLYDEEHAWVPAMQLKHNGNTAKVTLPIFKKEQDMLSSGGAGKKKFTDNKVIDLKDYPNQVLPMANVDMNGNLEDYKDMVQLPFVHEAAILYNLKLRHIKERPYTRTGDILIAMNPYQWFHELYTEKKRTYYSNRLVWETSDQDPRGTMEPHVYEVSALSYKGLAFGGVNQSVLVSGESGAGKTETVKICLNHIASVQRGQVSEFDIDDSEFDPIVQRIVESNPLLEAFGNAKTRRNDNSSRFGKYLQLQFDKGVKSDMGAKSQRCGLVGSKNEVYLLEKNRVVNHDSRERTFHVFYQLLAADDSKKSQFWPKLAGKTNESFKYVGSTDTKVIEGTSDADHFDATLRALEMVDVKDDKLNNLMNAICIVMQLGNITFASKNGDNDKSSISSATELKDLADLMKISGSDITLALTERTFTTKGETHKVPLNAEAAKDACDALAKEVYLKAFLWLSSEINKATCADESAGKDFGIIGMLDIFGFEAFQTNGFEQLCINYANEKLQQKFNEDIFRNVQIEYEAEGLDLDDIWYDDNTDVLDLIEGPVGLLNMLNEECVRPKGNDFDFVQKSLQQNKKAPCLIVHRTDRLSFGIKHYAGPVMYDGEHFVNRNNDLLPTDLQWCLEKCANPIVNTARSESVESRPASPVKSRPLAGGGRLMGGVSRRQSNIVAPTIWTKYKGQLNALMKNLRATESRYIRCIKPNSHKEPITCDHKAVVEQLRCAGVVAGITISRSVFPNRLDNAVVLSRYSNMWDKKHYPSKKTSAMSPEEKRSEDCKALMTCALKPKELYEGGKVLKAFVVGKTKTFFRAGALEWLESNRMQGLDSQAMTIQKAARGWLARRKLTEGDRRAAHEAEQAARKAKAEEMRQQRLNQEAADREAERQKEYKVLQDKVKQLNKEIAHEDKRRNQKLKELDDKKAMIKEENKGLAERLQNDLEKKVTTPKAELALQEKKIAEAKKLIAWLKKENKKVRAENAHYEEKMKRLKGDADALIEKNKEAGEQFEELDDSTRGVSALHDANMNTIEGQRKLNKDLVSKVTTVQDNYMEEAQARLELQKTMAKVLTNIQDNCTDRQIIEEAVVIALQCEAESKAQMAAVEAATSGL